MLALNASFPHLAYFGLPVLSSVVGAQGLLPVIVGNLVVSVLMVPITILLLRAMDGTKHESWKELAPDVETECASAGDAPEPRIAAAPIEPATLLAPKSQPPARPPSWPSAQPPCRII
jgi:hypothetical protein